MRALTIKRLGAAALIFTVARGVAATEVPVRYLVDANAFKGAVSGTNLTFELYTDADCNDLAHSEVIVAGNQALLAHEAKPKKIVGQYPKPLKAVNLSTVLHPTTLEDQFWLKVTGSGIDAIGEDCQPLPPSPLAVLENAVGNTQLADNAVASAEIQNGSITAADIAAGTITGNEISDGSIRNIDIDFETGPGLNNTAAGLNVLMANTTGERNTAVGNAALTANTTGNANTVLGAYSMLANTSGSNNTAVGFWALTSNETGGQNTAVGKEALYGNTTGERNVAVGMSALSNNGLGDSNCAVGSSALEDNLGDNNVAMGDSALRSNQTGTANTAVGTSALSANSGGSFNIAVGPDALLTSVSGSFNTAVGHDALGDVSGGTNNTALGADALDVLTTGDHNTALGTDALGNMTSGTSNISVGNSSGTAATTGSNNIWIGNTGANESNTVRIGTLAVHTKFFVRGVDGVNVGTSSAVLINSAGQLGTVMSSRKFKTDIHDMGSQSSRILALRPVTFHYKKDYAGDSSLQYGLIAEEVAEVFPELVVRNERGEVQTVQYHLLASLLLNELQKQQKTLDQQQDTLRSVRAENASMRAQLQDVSDLKRRLTALEERAERPSVSTATWRVQ